MRPPQWRSNDIGFFKEPEDTVQTLVKTVDAMGFSAKGDEQGSRYPNPL